MSSPDRILVLKVKEGMKVLSTTGAADPRLFTGENKLHAVMDTGTCLWRMKYDMGIVPEPLKGTFTGFKQLRKFAEQYFDKRNIEIVEVRD